jgi:hypothetical protein
MGLLLARRFWNRAGLSGLNRYDGATTGFLCPLEPFDGFIDPLVAVLGVGECLLPECIRLMQACCSAIHAALPIWRPATFSMIPAPASLT